MRNIARTGAILGLLVVVIGAFGAHGFKDRLAATGFAAQYETGVLYHAIHALAMILCAAVCAPGRARPVAAWSFIAGIVLFSGSLYAMGLTGARWLGAVTPIGGAAFIAGWIAFAVAARGRESNS